LCAEHHYPFARSRPPPLDLAEQAGNGPRQYARLLESELIERGAHRVGLARARLAVRQHGRIVAVEDALDQPLHRLLEQRLLPHARVVHVVVGEGLVVLVAERDLGLVGRHVRADLAHLHLLASHQRSDSV